MAATATRKPRRRFRIVIWLASAASALLVAMIVAILTVDLGRFKDPILTLASSALGREIRIDGALSIDIGRDIVILASAISVENAPWAASGTMLRIGSAGVTLETRSLLFRPLQLTLIDLEDVDLDYEQSPSGEINWAIAGSASDEPKDAGGATEQPVVLERLNVSKLHARIATPALEAPLELQLETLKHDANGDELTTEVVGTLSGEPIELMSRLAPRANIWQGTPIRVDIEGRLGDVALIAAGTIDNLLAPAQPEMELELAGPSTEYLLDLLHLPTFTSGPLDLELGINLSSGRGDLTASGVFGEFEVDASGSLTSLDATGEGEVDLHASGPSFRRVGSLFGFDRLPDEPFALSGHFLKRVSALEFDDVVLNVSDTELMLGGTLQSLSPVAGRSLAVQIEGDDIDRFRDLLQLPGVLTGPFALNVELLDPTDDATEVVRITGSIGEIEETITATINRSSGSLIGSAGDIEISGPDIRVVGQALGLDDLPALPFELVGSFAYAGDHVRVEAATAMLADIELEASGTVDLAYPGRLTAIRAVVRAPDVGAAFDNFGIGGLPNVGSSVNFRLGIAEGRATIEDLDLNLADTNIAGSLIVDLAAPLSNLELDLSVVSPDATVLTAGFGSSFRFRPAPLRGTLDAIFNDQSLDVRSATLDYAGGHAEIAGRLARPPNLSATNLDLMIAVPDLAAIGDTDWIDLPNASASLQGRFDGRPGRVTGSDLTLRLNDSLLSLDLDWLDGPVPAIELTATSSSIDLRALIPPPPLDDPVETVPASIETAQPEPDARTADRRLIPDFVIPVDRLPALSIRAQVTIDELLLSDKAFHAVGLTGRFEDRALVIDRVQGAFREGTAEATLTYAPAGESYSLEATVEGSDINIAPDFETDAQSRLRPRYDLEATLSASGISLRELASTLDGSVYLHAGSGIVPNATNRLTNLVLGDLFKQVLVTVNPFVSSDDRLELDCAIMLVDIEDGRLFGDPMLISETRQINIFANGSVDLGTEALDVDFRTQQRRGLGVSLSDLVNPYTKVAGTLASPQITLDPKGALVEGGVAAATGGLSILARGLRGRFLSDRTPCQTAVAAYLDRETTAAAEQE